MTLKQWLVSIVFTTLFIGVIASAADYPNSPNYIGKRTNGVVIETTTGTPPNANAGNPVSSNNPLPIICISGCAPIVPSTAGPVVSCSGTIATGGTAQVLVAGGDVVHYLLVQNVGVSNLGVGLTNAPVIGNAATVTLGPGSSMVFESAYITNSAMWIIGPTNSQPYTCWRG